MSRPHQQSNRLEMMKQSFLDLPVWVKVWMMFILGPANLASLAFLNQPAGSLIAALALSGMVLTISIVFMVGRFSKLAAAGHILPWTPLVFILLFAKPHSSTVYQIFLTALFIVNVMSLAFDFNDLRLWLKRRTHH